MRIAARTVQIVLVLLATIACNKMKPGETRIAAGDVPTASELDEFVSGAGQVRLTMTEDEVNAALGAKPTRRKEASSADDSTDVAWDNIGGAHPGAAAGRFVAGKLFQIEFAPRSPALPRVSAATASSLERAEVVQRAVASTLRMTDIESVTGSRGARTSWLFAHLPPDRASVRSVWAWEVEPGGRALIVVEQDGLAQQPVVRELTR